MSSGQSVIEDPLVKVKGGGKRPKHKLKSGWLSQGVGKRPRKVDVRLPVTDS